MKKFTIATSVLYKWRYWIGYGLIFSLLAGLLLVATFIIPQGLTGAELRSLVATNQLDLAALWKDTPLNAPFYLLQYASLSLFGLSELGIKLPSLLLGALTAVAMIFLLRRWFTPGIAVLTAVLAVTTGQFLFLTQQGSPSILYLFWPTILLLFATLVANRARYHGTWKVLFFIAAALSLYTPLSIYVLIALGTAILVHPHLRHIIKRLPRTRLAANTALALLLTTPLLITILRDPSIGLTLLGIPTEWPSLTANLQALANQYFGFMSLGDASVLMPVFSLASMLLIGYGLYRLVRSHETVQSHTVVTWLVLLLPALILNPLFTSITFVPLLLLLATGLQDILKRWYKLFPLNPYARIAGLIPLIVLVGSMTLFGLERYGYAYRYAPDTMHNFSQDIFLIPDTETLVVTPQQYELYQAVAAHSNLTVTTQEPSSGEYAVTAEAYDSTSTPASVVTTGRAQDAARFYIYK